MMKMKPYPLLPLIIAGPTASGKSSLALRLAEKFNGEIVCADSRQFYSGMSIGTACPSDEDRRRVVHHGYGIIDPAKIKIDAGFFVAFAVDKIEEIHRRNKRPILVGGTGLYLRSLYYGLDDVPQSNLAITEALHRRCDEQGLQVIYEELKLVDPDAALTIMGSDRYRIIRALEIHAITGEKPSRLRKSFRQDLPKIRAHWLYKKPDRSTINENIVLRVNEMFSQGLVEEAIRLREHLSADHWALSVMGYEEALMYSDGKIDLNDAKERVVIRHRQYAKRQFTWFNKEPFFRFVVTR